MWGRAGAGDRPTNYAHSVQSRKQKLPTNQPTDQNGAGVPPPPWSNRLPTQAPAVFANASRRAGGTHLPGPPKINNVPRELQGRRRGAAGTMPGST